ncbi:MAG: RNA polymerase sigma factor [Bacteroidota bacterium]
MFEKFYYIVQPWLKRMIYRICADQDVTYDLLQETWQTLLSRADRYDPDRGRITNFVFTIARNAALHNHRDGKRVSRLSEDYDLEDIAPQQDAAFEAMEKSIVLRKAIASLRENYQSVLLLHYYASLEVKEIAEMLAEPESTVKTWLRRGRQELAQLLPVEVKQ